MGFREEQFQAIFRAATREAGSVMQTRYDARNPQAMQRLGLFAHLSTKDMLVLGPKGPIDNALRFHDEPARHKLLDLIGDLALAGRPICAKITAIRSGHALNHAAARVLLDALK